MSQTGSPLNDPYYQTLQDMLATNQDEPQLFQTIVNAPFHDKLRAIQLDLGIVVLLLANKQSKTIDRIALSDTFSAQGAVRMSAKPFKDIKIPLGHKTNIIAQAIATAELQQTDNWYYLFVPALTREEAHFNQAGAGIECSLVQPLKGAKTGAMIFSFYQPLPKIGNEHREFVDYYSKLVATKL
ncbi:MAG TPA: hypothetical protein VM124_02025 [Candidatus Limnocylindrales bacterium]|nr:hypothetical protein [Candidatus Limnocylindrales bacterium]